ncbi:MAG: long-chain fatty acid--CoA ligase [Hydrogenophilales bacterium 16-64-46]|nr:MAG: long-chain fatty acid--CoA ligase [Hydrogenophilales bacterium 12-64-13]OYZ05263.1 MAG: long-chain fatty acid--CoA ligase [Hydrogenophilales bacterium 16-64-46]OZA37077.1 MAG: long-chain fatty acid--CoA ligase [Hydrogenophilales bacterium 17-64-34]HQT01306.1 long-chain fatty acid--CoA ligase [Thiobacillus sp.]
MTAGVFHPDTLGTLCGLFRARVAASPDAVAYRQYDDTSEIWTGFTWAQVATEVERWRRALVKEGLAPGDRVALMLKNCVEWVIFDQAALSLGLVTVPLYLDDRPENAAYILDHADARLLLVEGRFQHKKLAEIAGSAPQLERIVSLEAPENQLADWNPRFVVAADWLAAAADTPVPERHLTADLLASIVYTSGTTGRPKGVMLTHDNLLWNAYYASQCAAFAPHEVFLSFLPLSHTLERTGGYYLPMLLGGEVAYARSIAQLAQDLQTIRPTVLISVPRIYERVYGRIQDGLAKKNPIARTLFELAVRVGWRRFERAQGVAGWHPELLLWPLLKKRVASNVTDKLGGRLTLAISGGAALSPEIARVFIGLGIPIIQGYGLTETSPVVCVNRPDSNIPASIGQPLPGIEVKIGKDDELLTRSKCVMRGYWKNEEATRAMIDAEGWLHTGDKTKVDARGHYSIIGRIKDIIVLNNGEKVPPTDMESAILLDPLFEQVMVIGEGKPYLAALTVLNEEHWQTFAASLNVDPAHPAALSDPKVVKALTRRVAEHLKHFPGYAQIRRLHPELKPWTVDNGLLTPTLKVKRNQVLDRYRAAVEAMYADFARS